MLWSHPYSPISPFHRAGASGGGVVAGFSFVYVWPPRVIVSPARVYATAHPSVSSATRFGPDLRSWSRDPPRSDTAYSRPNDSVSSSQ